MASTSIPKIVAIQDAQQNTAGLITWWKLAGDVEIEKLRGAWDAAGHDPQLLPAANAPGAALKEAIRELAAKRRLGRPLGRGEGYALVAETPVAEDLEYTTLCTARMVNNELEIQPTGGIHDQRIRDAYARQRKVVRSDRIGSWLADLTRLCHAVGLRETGGIYFVPRDEAPRFRAWVEAFMEASEAVIYEVPALRSDEAVRAVLDSLTREADEELAEVEEKMDEDTKPGHYTKLRLGSCERRCESLMGKLGAYESLLGDKLDAVRERLEATKAGVVEAMLLAEADDDEDKD